MSGRRAAVAVLAGALLVTAWAYAPALRAGFVLDDAPNIIEAPGVHWTSISGRWVRALVEATPNPRRVVANLTLALNYLAGGLDPHGYHVVNLAIHLLMGPALLWLAMVYLRRTAPAVERDGGMPPAVAAGLATALFLLHPLGTQAVTYVVQRMASLAALFCVLSMAAYLEARGLPAGRRRLAVAALSVVSWLLALGSKENAVLLPLVLATYEVTVHGGEWRRRWREMPAARRRAAVVAGPLVVAAGVAALWRAMGPGTVGLLHRWPNRDYDGLERMLTQLRVQLEYLGLLLWPSPGRLALEHEVTVSRGLLDPPATLAAAVVWAGIVVAAVALARRRPRYGFPLLAYLEWHLLEAGPLNLELMFEHRMYLPMTALVLLVAVVLAEMPRRWWRAAAVAAVVAAAALAGATRARNEVWADPVALRWDTARKAPGTFRPWFNLGTYLGVHGRPLEAIAPLKRAVELAPDSSWAHNQLGAAYNDAGLADRALEEFREAVRLDPQNAEAVYNLAQALERRGEMEEAVRLYRRFLRVAPPELAEVARRVAARLRAMEGGHARAH